MNSIPSVGQTIFVHTDQYSGPATVTFVDHAAIHVDHFYPVQCDVPMENLSQIDEFNHDQTMMRFNLGEISFEDEEFLVSDNDQLSLFDEY